MHNSRNTNDGPPSSSSNFSKRPRNDDKSYDNTYDNSSVTLSSSKRSRPDDVRPYDYSEYPGYSTPSYGANRDYGGESGYNRYQSQYYSDTQGDNGYYERNGSGWKQDGQAYYSDSYSSNGAYNDYYGSSNQGSWDDRSSSHARGGNSYWYSSNDGSGRYPTSSNYDDYHYRDGNNTDYSRSNGDYGDSRGHSQYSNTAAPSSSSSYYRGGGSSGGSDYNTSYYGGGGGGADGGYDVTQRYDYNIGQSSSYYRQNRNNAGAGIGSTYYNKLPVNDKPGWNKENSNADANTGGNTGFGFRKSFYTPRVYSFGTKRFNKPKGTASAVGKKSVTASNEDGTPKTEQPEAPAEEPPKVVSDPAIKFQAQMCFSVIDHHFASVLAKLNVRLTAASVQSIPAILGLNSTLSGPPEPITGATAVPDATAPPEVKSVPGSTSTSQEPLKPLLLPLQRQASTSSVTSTKNDEVSSSNTPNDIVKTILNKMSNSVPNSAAVTPSGKLSTNQSGGAMSSSAGSRNVPPFPLGGASPRSQDDSNSTYAPSVHGISNGGGYGGRSTSSVRSVSSERPLAPLAPPHLAPPASVSRASSTGVNTPKYTNNRNDQPKTPSSSYNDQGNRYNDQQSFSQSQSQQQSWNNQGGNNNNYNRVQRSSSNSYSDATPPVLSRSNSNNYNSNGGNNRSNASWDYSSSGGDNSYQSSYDNRGGGGGAGGGSGSGGYGGGYGESGSNYDSGYDSRYGNTTGGNRDGGGYDSYSNTSTSGNYDNRGGNNGGYGGRDGYYQDDYRGGGYGDATPGGGGGGGYGSGNNNNRSFDYSGPREDGRGGGRGAQGYNSSYGSSGSGGDGRGGSSGYNDGYYNNSSGYNHTTPSSGSYSGNRRGGGNGLNTPR